MAIIIRGKSKCPLCNQILEEHEKITAYTAFLPNTHRLGKYSDGAFHSSCWEKCPDKEEFEELYHLYLLILRSRPKALKTVEEIEAWQKEAFQDFPPKGRVVIFEQCFTDDCEVGDWWYMDADDYQAMCEAEDKAYKEMEERRAEADRRERDAWRYARDD